MWRAEFRFYADLNDFLPADRQQRPFHHAFDYRASIKDMIESLGVPHTEVELLLVDGIPVDFNHIVADGERISAYPPFNSLPVPERDRLRPPLPAPPRFILDGHLGKLAAYLRLLGFDAAYQNHADDDVLARISAEQDRVLLTRDRGLLKRSVVTYGCCLRTTDSRQQLLDVIRRYDLVGLARPFSRCLRCNGLLHAIEKAAIADRLLPLTKKYYDDFRQCDACGKIYWPGSHYDSLKRFIEAALRGERPPEDVR